MHRICIAGRPNVGKSTLFNRLYGKRSAITDSMPGVTRDAISGTVSLGDLTLEVIDTGGIGEGEAQLEQAVCSISRNEIRRADLVLLLVDVTDLTGEDEELIEYVRRCDRPVILVVNKVDNEQRVQDVSEFWRFGLERVVSISAAHGLGMDDLEDAVLEVLGVDPDAPEESSEAREQANDPDHSSADTDDEDSLAGEDGDHPREDPLTRPVRLAILGQPNTGKSSLLNRLVGEERALVSDIAGTTRDTVESRFSYKGTEFNVVDTAGIRRKSRVRESVEYYAVQRALAAIDDAELVVLVIDAVKGLSEQDKKIAARVAERGRGVVVILNKWDLMEDRENALNALTDRIHFLFPVFRHVPILPTSTITGEGVGKMLDMLLHVRGELHRRIDTGPLNQALKRWLEQTPPPSGKRPIKIRYMTQVHANPVRFVLFTNRKKLFPEFYLRYIQNQIRQDFGFRHIPFFVELRE
ncbi:GTP-binding protein [Alkalispirochaeta americana]|uniref:GTPase Der n=1 Tax=Alkalispirochaeta americana TaxID=159291 RepID=A0A1N6W180_9SPIO|nr:ribosome biogenesis GTPase Der [Alkalispirochaeta americana]SIQ83666.1 GTP-binding protein [Alkalispirochaeta americana]